jgi:hypothetical protein
MTTKKVKKPVKKVVAKKPVAKKPTKKPVSKKKTNKKVFMLDGHSVSDFEMKYYQKEIRRMLASDDRNAINNDVPAPGEIPQEKVVQDELNILGKNYDKAILDANTAPTLTDVENFSATMVTPAVTPTNDYGVLTDVAVKFGCPVDVFNKLITFMIQSKILPVGKIIEYNQNIKKFIRHMHGTRKLEALEAEAKAFVVEKGNEKDAEYMRNLTDRIDNLKEILRNYDGAL